MTSLPRIYGMNGTYTLHTYVAGGQKQWGVVGLKSWGQKLQFSERQHTANFRQKN